MVGGGWIADGGIFHILETLQCFVERRKGGETGIRAVHHLEKDAVWSAAEEGRWSKELMKAALGRAQSSAADGRKMSSIPSCACSNTTTDSVPRCSCWAVSSANTSSLSR